MRRSDRWVLALALAGLLAPVAGCSGGTDLEGDGETDGTTDDVVSDGGGDADADAPVDGTDVAADEASADDAVEAVDDGGGPGCEPQDARADGPCAAIVPGVRWDGAHCVGLGSGCSCAGEDCDEVYETVEDCVAARLECYGATCDAQPAAGRTCDGGGCAEVLGAFWDGRGCFQEVGCECVGDGCDAPFASLEECAAVHAGCDGALCVATGGRWFPADVGLCGFECGVVGEIDCESPMDSCDCGSASTFVHGLGCEEVDGCNPALLCRATGGAWHDASECYCGFSCGSPGVCGACLDSCDCGPARNFDDLRGCVADTSCSGYERAEICRATGGVWHDCSAGDPFCSCGDYLCGRPNTLDPCVMPGCDCGPFRGFDDVRGCVHDDTCVFRGAGEECGGVCRAGLVCCEGCGAPPGCPTCGAPCCPDDPSCMDGGCPMPPP